MNKLRLFITDLMITVLAWGGFYRRSFGTDTLFRCMMPESDIGGAFDQQRYASYLLATFLLDHGIQITDHYRLFFFLFLLSIAVDMWLLQLLFFPLFESEKEEDGRLIRVGCIGCTALIFLNILFSENFMFPEYHINYAFAYLLGTLAVCAFARRKPVPAVLLLLVACSFYQIVLPYAAMLITAFLVIERRFVSDKNLIVRVALYNVLIGAVGAVNYFSNAWLRATGLFEELYVGKEIQTSFAETAGYLLSESVLLFKNSLCLMPSVWLPLLLLLISLVVLVRGLLDPPRQNRLVTLLLFLLVEAAWFYLLPELAGIGSLTPRVAFTFYAAQAMLLFAAILLAPGARWRVFAACVMVGYLFLQIFLDQVIISNHYLSNRLDLLYAESVLREIDKYEERTGIIVKNIAIENDIDAPNSYEEVKFKRDQINERVIAVAPFTLLEYANGPGMVFKHVEMDPGVHETYFAGRNWDHFDPEEQLVFVDDTLYWVIF